MSNAAKKTIRKDLIDCHWSGRIFGQIDQRLDCAGGSLNDGDLNSAEHHVYQARRELKDSAWVIGKSAALRLSKLLDDPYEAIKKAQVQKREGKQGRVARGRLRPAEQAVMKAMHRASNKCK